VDGRVDALWDSFEKIGQYFRYGDYPFQIKGSELDLGAGGNGNVYVFRFLTEEPIYDMSFFVDGAQNFLDILYFSEASLQIKWQPNPFEEQTTVDLTDFVFQPNKWHILIVSLSNTEDSAVLQADLKIQGEDWLDHFEVEASDGEFLSFPESTAPFYVNIWGIVNSVEIISRETVYDRDAFAGISSLKFSFISRMSSHMFG
jgi:hypothetical protein